MRRIAWLVVGAVCICLGVGTAVQADVIIDDPEASGADGLDPGTAELNVNVVTGVMTVVGNAVNLTSYTIESPKGNLIPGTDPAPFLSYFSNTPTYVFAFSLGLNEDVSVPSPPPIVLDTLFDTTALLEDRDLVFSYGRKEIGGEFTGHVHYVPEPVSLTLLGLGGLGVVLKRKRRRVA